MPFITLPSDPSITLGVVPLLTGIVKPSSKFKNVSKVIDDENSEFPFPM